MQLVKSVALPVALVASLATAAPFQVSSDNKLSVRSQPTVELLTDPQVDTRSESPAKRLSWGKAAIGAGSALVGWLTSKEGQEFLDSDEGLDFVSKLTLNDDVEEAPSKRLNAAAMIGLTGSSVLKGMFGSKEAEELLSTPEGQAFLSKLASNDDDILSTRDVESDDAASLDRRLNFSTGFKAGLKVFGGLFDDDDD